MRKPRRLREGDLVAVVSPSWGGPAEFPAAFEAGLRALAELGLRVREYPTTRAANAPVRARVDDLHAAFADPEVRAIVTSIGGDDSVRLLPKLKEEHLRNDPKIVLGYSDSGTLLSWLVHHGVVAFHGPSVMAGLAQAQRYPPSYRAMLRAILFDAVPRFEYPRFGVACEGYEADWSPRALVADAGARRLLGAGVARGRLYGGCLETLEAIKGTTWWPEPADWAGAVIMVEGSEAAPPPDAYRRALRSWLAGGRLEHVSALLIGRARGYDAAMKAALDAAIGEVIVEEAERPDMVVLTSCEFGHTDPQWLLPLGCEVEIDAARATVTLLEPAVS
ncbi:MAG: LD-carboxypeptidase [Labilithrix sp.]|nr:LD-carboxypeptidase [Labilithrix sp.]MCW5812921.1 LD-carboxypeptidase [Labilithrix sp.]